MAVGKNSIIQSVIKKQNSKASQVRNVNRFTNTYCRLLSVWQHGDS